MMRTASHMLTRTYKYAGLIASRAEAGLPFRQVLARDLWDYRQIEPQLARQVIPAIIDFYRQNYPALIDK